MLDTHLGSDVIPLNFFFRMQGFLPLHRARFPQLSAPTINNPQQTSPDDGVPPWHNETTTIRGTCPGCHRRACPSWQTAASSAESMIPCVQVHTYIDIRHISILSCVPASAKTLFAQKRHAWGGGKNKCDPSST